jgi:hypothetical protein
MLNPPLYAAWDSVIGVLLILLIEPATFMQQFLDVAVIGTMVLLVGVRAHVQRKHRLR